MSGNEPQKPSLKQRVAHETEQYLLIAAYLACYFLALTSYRKLVLAEYHIGYFEYGWALLQAAILAKVILIGEAMHLGRRWEDRPLIVTTLVKSVLFAALAAALVLLEHVVKSRIHHERLADVLSLQGARGQEVLARVQLMLVVFVPFFAFREIDRAAPEAHLFDLFFRRRPPGKDGGRG